MVVMDSVVSGPPFHTGFVVPRLEPAMACWEQLGVRWAEPIRSSSWWRREGSGPCEASLGVVYSTGPGPLIELVAPEYPALFGLGSDTVLHHVGYYVDDVAATAARLEADGWPVVLSRHTGPDEETPALTFHRAPGTTAHVELVPAAMRDVITAWTST